MGKRFIYLVMALLFCVTVGTQAEASQAYSKVELVNKKIVNVRNADFALNLIYPRVEIPHNAVASSKINSVFATEMARRENEYIAKQGSDDITAMETKYQVDVNNKKFLIFRIRDYYYAYRAAHPSSGEGSVAFSVRDGRELTWRDLLSAANNKKVNLAALNAKLNKHPMAENFFKKPAKLTAFPENYFIDTEGALHFLFGQYELAPYACGFIDVPMGVKIIKG